jgi:Protein of unknown function (DUF2911)
MFARKIVHTLCGVVLLGVFATSSTGAFENANRATHFTFSGPVRLPGATLPAGTYTFAIVNPFTGSDAVTVKSRDGSKLYALKLTRSSYRPASRDMKPTITFGEAPAGTPPPVKAWYPDGDTHGREFIY